MPTPPARHKAIEDFTAEDHIKDMAAKNRGESYKPETDEYREYKADGLRALGLDDEADAAEPEHGKVLEDMTAEEHYARLHRPGYTVR